MTVCFLSRHTVVINSDLRPLLPLSSSLFLSSAPVISYVVTRIHSLGNCQFPIWKLLVTFKETTSSLHDV